MMDAASPLRVLIVDDEAPARARLRTLLGECTALPARVVGEAADAAQARAWLAHGTCDLVLLDIALPGPSGLVLAADLRATAPAAEASALAAAPGVAGPVGPPVLSISPRVPPAIVFVTAHADHALLAFELDAADYLTKPVRRERLQAALQRVAQRRAGPPAVPDARAAIRADDATDHGAEHSADGHVIVVQERGGLLRIPVGEVLYLRAELKYLTLRTAERSMVLAGTLGDYEQRLGHGFLRIHRNALVAVRAVRVLERGGPSDEAEEGDAWTVRLVGIDDRLPVSRRQLAAVRGALSTAR